MLKLGKREKKILDLLLVKETKAIIEELGITDNQIYATKSYFLRKVQNAREFLAVANSKYKPLLSRRLKTPKIMPEDEDLW